jgi:hypothetical protein
MPSIDKQATDKPPTPAARLLQPIPVYMKTSAQMTRPHDEEFFLITRDGTFKCRNHQFFQSDVPARKQPKSLAQHQSRCIVRYPKLGRAALEYIIGFFDRIYRLHQSEAVVLLYWDTIRERYRLVVPEQEASVWATSSGKNMPLDVKYKIPLKMPAHWLLAGDIHSHGDINAYASAMDQADEHYRDGVHGIIGRIEDDPPAVHLELAIDGSRFTLKPGQLFRGYHKRRLRVPQAWIDRVKVVVEHSTWSFSSGTNGGYSQYNSKK